MFHNSTLLNFKIYNIVDSTELDSAIRTTVQYHIENSIDKGLIFAELTLRKGSTYIMLGHKLDDNFASIIVYGYSLNSPLCGKKYSGNWTWN